MTCPRQQRRVFASCLGADGARTMQPIRRGGGAVRIGKRSTAHRVAAKGCGRQHHINRFATRSVWEQMTRDTALRDDDC